MIVTEIASFVLHVVWHGHFWPPATRDPSGVQLCARRVFAVVAAPSRVASCGCIFKIPLLDVPGSKLGDRLKDFALCAFLVRYLL